MQYFLDTEFIEDGRTIDLVSIGLVAADGREYYAENLDADLSKASDWVKENVIANLWSKQPDKARANAWSRDGGNGGLLNRIQIARDVQIFCSPERYGKPEFWGYYADYDWVALCQLFGTMMQLPKGFPMYCRDIKQLCDFLGNPMLPEQGKGEHHALADAKWNQQAYLFLRKLGAGALRITEERVRQINTEGWPPSQDDHYTDHELIFAALAYANHAKGDSVSVAAMDWPWDKLTFKPADAIRDCEKAGALLAAEIDRLQRAQGKENLKP